MYNIGDIFKDDEEYSERAKWARENGAQILFYEKRLEDIEKTRQVEKKDSEGNSYFEEETYTEKEYVKYYQLVEIPTPTEKELAHQRISELKEKLASTDYVVIKIAEGEATAEDYSEILAQRKAWRAEINQLEALGA